MKKARNRSAILLLACTILVLFLLVELFFSWYNSRFYFCFRFENAAAAVKIEDLEKVINSPRFSPDLGWDENPIARHFDERTDFLAQSYGDSFVKCLDVEDRDTWQSIFDEMTGKGIVNLGVGGYGLDQSVLKFEKYGKRFKTPYVILGLYADQYERNLSRCPVYYLRTLSDRYAFKPMFLKKGKEFEFVPIPCANADCLLQIWLDRSGTLVNFLRENDPWFLEDQSRPALRFPHTLAFLRVLPDLWHLRSTREERKRDPLVKPGALEVSEYLLNRFITDALQREMKPLILLLYSPMDLQQLARGTNWHQPVIQFLKDHNIPFVDTGAYILQRVGKDFDFARLRAGIHLNGVGNRMVAEALALHLRP